MSQFQGFGGVAHPIHMVHMMFLFEIHGFLVLFFEHSGFV